ncbi:MAG: c-type cytochrome [Opitutaceae bacterium]
MNQHIQLAVLAGLVAVASSYGAEPNIDQGKKVYGTTCIVCHGKDGKGTIPGVPDLAVKNSRLMQDENVLFERVRDGFQSSGSPLAMPPKGGNPTLTDTDIRDTLAYMRDSFPKKTGKK